MKKQGVMASMVLALWLFPTAVRADYIYAFDPINPTVYSDQSGMGIDLSDGYRSDPTSGNVLGVTAIALTTFINPGTTGTDTFNTGQTSGLRATIIDGTASASVEFLLGFSGLLGADISEVALMFKDETTKTVTVNDHMYTISLLGPSFLPGNILARITLDGSEDEPDDGGGTDGGPREEPPNPVNAPEPATALLGAVGSALAALAIPRWRKRRAVQKR
jgi:hypothetical protein